MRFTGIIRNINVLNILLLAGVAVFAANIVPALIDGKVQYAAPVPKKVVENEEQKAAQTQTPSISEYTLIAEQNLFHPERRIPPPKVEEKPLPKPEFVLYGTLITGDVNMAFIEDIKAPQSAQNKGKRQKRALRLGSSLSGYTLNEVHNDRVVMARGEDKIEVKVAGSPKTRAASASAAQPAAAPARGAAVSAPKTPAVQTPRPSRVRRDIQRPPITPGAAGSNRAQ